MDEKDIEILKELIKNANVTLGQLAGKLNMSISTIHKRLNNLNKHVIEQYTVVVDPKLVGINIIAFLGISLDFTFKENIIEYLKERKWAQEIYELLEPFDLFVKVKVGGIKDLKDIIREVSNLEGVREVSSFIVTERHKERYEV